MSDVPADTVDPKRTDSYRMLKAVVIGLGVLIVIAVVLLVVGLATRLAGHGAAAQSAAGQYQLSAGAKIVSLQVANNRLVMEVREKGGDRVLIFNTDDGKLVGQIAPPEK
jgi:flagellar basal body-associated protein FliL